MGVIEHFIFCFDLFCICCTYINIFNIYSLIFNPIPKFDFHIFTFSQFFTCFLLFFLLLFFLYFDLFE